MSDNKIYKTILAGTLAISTLFPISAEAKPINVEAIAQSQQEPTFKQDLDRYGRKIKDSYQRSKKNIGERFKDRNSWEAKKCELTKSTTERCKILRNKTKL